MFLITYEPITRQNKYITDGGVTHAVNTDRIEDIYFWGDMACVCLVSGARFNVVRQEALELLDNICRYDGEGASEMVAKMEDAGSRYEMARNDVAKGAGKR